MKAYKEKVTKYYKWGDTNVTLVGSPTVSNGVVSGFSTSNYLIIPNGYKSNDATYVFKFTTGSSFSSQQVVVHGEFLLNLEITTNKAVQFYNWGSGASYTLFTAQANKTYWVKVVINGTSKTYSYSTDGKTFSGSKTITDTSINPSNTSYTFRLGLSSYNSSSPFLGSIDLKECYMIQNEIKTWTGLQKVHGTSSNFDFSEDVDVCKVYKTTVRKYYKYTNWTQPTLTANGTMGGSSFAVSASSEYDAPRKAYCAFDGITTNNGTSGCWHSSAGFPAWIQFYNPVKLKVSKLTLYNRTSDGAIINTYGVAYSDDGTNFIEFLTGTSPNQSHGASWVINIDAGSHKYWRIISKSCSGSNNAYTTIGEIKITAQEFREGSKTDYTSYEDVNIYKSFKTIIRKYYKYQYSNWAQPVLTANGTMGGSTFAVTQSHLYSSEYAYFAFDANDSTQWANNGNTGDLIFYNPKPINVTKINVMNGFDSSYTRPISSGTLLASNDGNSYKTIKTFTNSNTTAKGTWNIDVSSNTGYYKYYKLSVVGDGSYARITNLTITAKVQSIIDGTENDYVFFEDK